MTPNDALIQATQDLCDILNNKEPVKGKIRFAIEMLIDIFKGYDGEPTKIDEHRSKTEKAAANKEESVTEDKQVNKKELENEEMETEDVFTIPNEANLGQDDLNTLNQQVTCPKPSEGPQHH